MAIFGFSMKKGLRIATSNQKFAKTPLSLGGLIISMRKNTKMTFSDELASIMSLPVRKNGTSGSEKRRERGGANV